MMRVLNKSFFRSSINGKIISKFICIGEPESTSSDDLCKFVNEELDNFGFKDHMNKLIGFGSDGASNMTGHKRGMVTQLKNDNPEMIGIHCLSHRLELAFKDVIKGEKSFEQLTTLLYSESFYGNPLRYCIHANHIHTICT